MTPKQKLLRDMWEAGAAVKDIAAALGVSVAVVYSLRHQYGLPKRAPVFAFPDDPTPEQIAERARECREAHYARRRAETDDTVRTKVWKRRQRESA